MSKDIARLNSNVPGDLYCEVKRLLIDDGRTITQLVIDLLREWVAKQCQGKT